MNKINTLVSLTKRNIITNVVIQKYSFGPDAFTKEEGGFYIRDFETDVRLNNPNVLRIVLDPISKYSTDIVIY